MTGDGGSGRRAATGLAARLPSRARARLDPDERYGLRLTLLGLAVVLVAVPFSTLTFQVLDGGALTRLDGRLADDLNERIHRHPAVLDAVEAVSFWGRALVLAAIVALVVAALWRAGRTRTAVFLVVTSIGGGLVSSAVKVAVDRPRPVVDHPVSSAFGKSFPSGHTLSSTVVYGAILLALWPVLRPAARSVAVVLTTVLVVAVGTSRLLLGVHFLSDVVGGFVLGLAWLAGSAAAFAVWRDERWDEHRRRHRLDVDRPGADRRARA